MKAFDPAVIGRPDPARAAEILSDPHWLPHSFNPAGDALVFVQVSDELRKSAAFLDGEAVRPLEKAVIPTDWVQDATGSLDAAPVHFIFHTALCGSTMLVRALEEAGPVAGLKEPAILLNLYHRFARGDEAQERARLGLVLRLLGRPFPGSAAVVVKPSCFVNPLACRIMAALPESKAVLLSSDLRSFLLGIAKRGVEGRSWGRQVFADCRRMIPLEFGFSSDQLLEQTDLQIAGLAWLMRRWLFDRVAKEHRFGRTLRLQSHDLFESPAATLENVSDFLGLEAEAERFRKVAGGSVFRWHSKESGRRYEPTDRNRELAEVESKHGAEAEPVARWIEALASHRGIEADVPAARLL